MAINHISILLSASSGMGKSYLANLLILSLKHKYKIIIDYSGEYETPGFVIIELNSQNYIEYLKYFDRYLKKYKNLIIRFIDFDDDEIMEIVNTICNWCFKIGNVLIVFDEAHNYIPHSINAKKKAKWIIKVATMGRKYGISSIFITQRPALLNPTIRSNTNIKIIGRLTDPNDMNAVKPYIYNYEYIPYLPKRHFIYRNLEGQEYIVSTEGYQLPHSG